MRQMSSLICTALFKVIQPFLPLYLIIVSNLITAEIFVEKIHCATYINMIVFPTLWDASYVHKSLI